jgi:hypothetical protein
MAKELWGGYFISFFDDGTIGVSDGVGYSGSEQDVKGLYLAMKEYFESKAL